MYAAIDEAGSHVGSKSFRLVVGVYSQAGKDLLGSACSQPVRVMANNDIPKGAAHIPLVVNIRCCHNRLKWRQANTWTPSFAVAECVAGSTS